MWHLRTKADHGSVRVDVGYNKNNKMWMITGILGTLSSHHHVNSAVRHHCFLPCTVKKFCLLLFVVTASHVQIHGFVVFAWVWYHVQIVIAEFDRRKCHLQHPQRRQKQHSSLARLVGSSSVLESLLLWHLRYKQWHTPMITSLKYT